MQGVLIKDLHIFFRATVFSSNCNYKLTLRIMQISIAYSTKIRYFLVFFNGLTLSLFLTLFLISNAVAVIKSDLGGDASSSSATVWNNHKGLFTK